MRLPANTLAAVKSLAMAVTAAAIVAPIGRATMTAQSAEAFAVETSWQGIRAQYGRVWPKLHPRCQRVTSRERWEACQRKEARQAAEWEFLSVRATDAYPDSMRFPLLGRIRFTAVTLRARARHAALGVRTITDTVYVVKVAGRWKGLWEPESYRAYRAGKCPP
jgi:hypothetical protein